MAASLDPTRAKPGTLTRSSRSAATAAACWRQAPTSISCSCSPDRADPKRQDHRRDDPLRAVGPQAEGRPRHALGRRMPQPGARRHDDPHRAARGALAHAATRRCSTTLRARFDKEIVAKTASEFVAAKLAERDSAHQARRRLALSGRAQRQGGQGRPARPQHAVLDRQIRLSGATTRSELVGAGLFTAERIRAVLAAARNSSGRCAATCISSPAAPEERLSFDLQRPIAERLGYASRAGQTDVERFMKHYFLVAKDVGDLTAIVCAALEERQAKPPQAFDRFLGALRRRPSARCRRRRISRSTTTASTSSTPTCSSAIRSI